MFQNGAIRTHFSKPCGCGHNRSGVKLSITQVYAKVSLNDLTYDKRLDTLTGNAAFSGVPVHIENR